MLLLMLATLMVQAQQLDPVKWKYSVKETSATEAELVFTAKLDAGWHLYSQYTDPNGPLAIEFTFAESGDYARMGKVQEPKPHEEMDDIFNCVVKSFSGTVVFRQKVKRISDKDFTVKGTVSYQLCNDGSCIAPEDHDFSFKVPGAKAELATATVAAAAEETVAVETVADSVTEAETVAEADTVKATVEPLPQEEGKRQNLLVVFLL